MFIDVLHDDEPLTYEPGNNFLIYSDQEIASATSELEKKRRFWNEKAEQLANNPQTPTANKTALSWIIYVAWTLRKTSFIEGDAKKASQEENGLFPKEEASTRKVTSQKPGTMTKNMERIDAAHVALNLSKRWSNDNFAKPPD